VVERFANAEPEYIGRPPERRAHPLDRTQASAASNRVMQRDLYADGVDWAVPGAAGAGAETMDLDTYLAVSRAYEAKIDSRALTVDFLSRAYEIFKARPRHTVWEGEGPCARHAHARPPDRGVGGWLVRHWQRYRNQRLSLYMAAQIAQHYAGGGDHETALTCVLHTRAPMPPGSLWGAGRGSHACLRLPHPHPPASSYRYCQKIAKSYRRERWSALLADVLTLSLTCADRLGRGAERAAFALELLSDGAAAAVASSIFLGLAFALCVHTHSLGGGGAYQGWRWRPSGAIVCTRPW
jgi:hypothetical protein